MHRARGIVRGARIVLQKIDHGQAVLIITRDAIVRRNAVAFLIPCCTNRENASILGFRDVLVHDVVGFDRRFAAYAHVHNAHVVLLSDRLRAIARQEPAICLSKGCCAEISRIAFARFDDHEARIVRSSRYAFSVVRISSNDSRNVRAMPISVGDLVDPNLLCFRIVGGANIPLQVFVRVEATRVHDCNGDVWRTSVIFLALGDLPCLIEIHGLEHPLTRSPRVIDADRI